MIIFIGFVLGKAQVRCVKVDEVVDDDLSIGKIEKVFGLSVNYTAISVETLESIQQNCQDYSNATLDSLKMDVYQMERNVAQCLKVKERLKRIAQGFSIQAFVHLSKFSKDYGY